MHVRLLYNTQVFLVQVLFCCFSLNSFCFDNLIGKRRRADVGDGVRRSCHFPSQNCIRRQDKQQVHLSSHFSSVWLCFHLFVSGASEGQTLSLAGVGVRVKRDWKPVNNSM